MNILIILKQLFCGPEIPKKKVQKPGRFYRRQIKVIKDVWNCKKEYDFGIERVLRLFCACIQFISLANLFRELFGFAGFKARKLFVDVWVLLNLAYPLILIKTGLWDSCPFIILLVYLTVETVIYLLNLIVLKPYLPQPSSYTRNLLSLFLNYLQVAFAFSAFYLNAGLKYHCNNATGLQSIYYSLVTQTTVGFGDIVPTDNLMLLLTILHVIISLLFVYLFFGYMISQVGNKTFMSNHGSK